MTIKVGRTNVGRHYGGRSLSNEARGPGLRNNKKHAKKMLQIQEMEERLGMRGRGSSSSSFWSFSSSSSSSSRRTSSSSSSGLFSLEEIMAMPIVEQTTTPSMAVPLVAEPAEVAPTSAIKADVDHPTTAPVAPSGAGPLTGEDGLDKKEDLPCPSPFVPVDQQPVEEQALPIDDSTTTAVELSGLDPTDQPPEPLATNAPQPASSQSPVMCIPVQHLLLGVRTSLSSLRSRMGQRLASVRRAFRRT